MRWKARRGLAAVLLLLAVGTKGAWALEYAAHAIDIPCEGTFVPLPADVNGDGRTDLLVWDGRSILLYAGSENGFIPPECPFPPPDGARLFDAGDIDGDGVDELVYLTPEGVFFARLLDGRPGPANCWLDAACDLPGRHVGPAPLVRDVDGNGRIDVWFIEGGHLRVALSPLPGQVVASTPLPLVGADEPLTPEGLPFRVHLLDLDGDAVDDLLCVTPDGLGAFRLDVSSGRFGFSSAWHLPFARYLDEDDAREIVDEDLADVSLFEDVTGDGQNEFFLSSWSRGQVYLFRGGEVFFEPDPLQVFDVGPVVTAVTAVRPGGSGAPRLLIHRFEPPSIPGALLRVVTRRKITVKFGFLLFEPEDPPGLPYPDQPSDSRRISVQARRGDERKMEPRFVVDGADFNGDGWEDLAILANASSIEFHWARGPDAFKRGDRIPPIFSREEPPPMSLAEFSQWTHDLMLEHLDLGDPDLVVPIPSPRGFMIRRQYAEDLNGDGADDLMLPFRPMDDEGSCRLVVLLSSD